MSAMLSRFDESTLLVKRKKQQHKAASKQTDKDLVHQHSLTGKHTTTGFTCNHFLRQIKLVQRIGEEVLVREINDPR